ncbi:hypothetical protein [Clostridium sporogenes]|uniref:hypothetical protein n=1 Tax=Clostridium sporogenes TaxID=1509 RepID=UPI001F22CE10|nr:hypothetical protein [Clostridium sporogenes]UJA30557.1 hypothetical protein L0894_10485 [Clostridium sporogenes]
MRHESNEKVKLDISDSFYTFEEILEMPYTPNEFLDSIKKSDVLLLPCTNFRDKEGYFFPEETYKFYDYLLEKGKENGLNIEICISNDEYNELELHADVINIAKIFVQWVVFPALTSMLASYLYEKLKHFNRNDINTKVDISVERNGKAKTIHYEGNIENFESAMKSIDEHIFK